MKEGWIKVYRQLTDKGFYKDSEYVHLWIHLLLKATHKDTEFLFNNKIQKLKAGQLLTGRLQLASETGINESKVERILNCFKTEQQIEQQKNNKFRLITIKNWEEYQGNEQQNEQPVNNQRTTSEQPVNTYKNVKNIKKYISSAGSQISFPASRTMVVQQGFQISINDGLLKSSYPHLTDSELSLYLVEIMAWLESKKKEKAISTMRILNWLKKTPLAVKKDDKFYEGEMERLGFAAFCNTYGMDLASKISQC